MKKKDTLEIVLVFSILSLLISIRSVWSQSTEYQDRPIKLGTSGGNISDITRRHCCSGTLGSLVQDGSAAKYILSNNHVLARTNLGGGGEDIIQPGLADLDCSQDSSDAVADLSKFVPISFKKRTTNVVDAAIAQIRTGMVDTSGSILGIGEISRSTISPSLNIPVQKSGRTTGLTHGTISSVNVSVTVSYNKTCGKGSQKAKFTGQIMITPGGFSAGGDSGSLIVYDCSSSPGAVGLLFAGSNKVTIANPINNVLSSLSNISPSSTLTMVGTSSTCTPLGATSITGSPSMTAQSQLPPHLDHRAVEAVNRVKERHEDAILKMEGVVGMGVGLSEAVPEEIVIEIYVKKSAQEMKYVIPEMLEDVPVKIIETGEIIAF